MANCGHRSWGLPVDTRGAALCGIDRGLEPEMHEDRIVENDPYLLLQLREKVRFGS